jgi:hypothetical protein
MNMQSHILRRARPPGGTILGRWGRAAIALVAVVVIVASSAAAQESLHGFHPIMPGQRLYFRCWSAADGDKELHEAPLSVNSVSVPAKMRQRIALPEPWPALELVEFLPAAVLEQEIVVADADGGRPAIELAISGPSQSMRRWLIADDPARNRLTSLIATWRLMAVADVAERDDLLRQFQEELIREPKLRVSGPRSGQPREVALHVGTIQNLDELGCTVLVRRFFPHYARDNDAAEPVNLSEKRVNPAALVEIRQGTASEQRWVFAKFPSFRQAGDRMPFDITLDCPVDISRPLPDFALVAVDPDAVEVWIRHQGDTRVRLASPAEPIEIPGSSYSFRMARFVPSGRLMERYTSAPNGPPALAVRFPGSDGTATTTWLALGNYRTVETPAGALTIGFDQNLPASGGHP